MKCGWAPTRTKNYRKITRNENQVAVTSSRMVFYIETTAVELHMSNRDYSDSVLSCHPRMAWPDLKSHYPRFSNCTNTEIFPGHRHYFLGSASLSKVPTMCHSASPCSKNITAQRAPHPTAPGQRRPWAAGWGWRGVVGVWVLRWRWRERASKSSRVAWPTMVWIRPRILLPRTVFCTVTTRRWTAMIQVFPSVPHAPRGRKAYKEFMPV